MSGKRESGFTLVEVMIVVAVFGIMAAIAIPAFMKLLPGMRLNGAARMVMGDLMAARMKAVKLNQLTKVSFDGGHAYKICNDENNDGAVGSTEGDNITMDLHKESANQEAKYEDVTFTNEPSDVVFSPRGTASNRTFVLQNSAGSKTIRISIAGRVKID
jgi:type IV fimbrial biogenesis protein FimT